jgi:hypothetical protein
MLTRVGILCVVKGVMLVEVKIVRWIGYNTPSRGSARTIGRSNK